MPSNGCEAHSGKYGLPALVGDTTNDADPGLSTAWTPHAHVTPGRSIGAPGRPTAQCVPSCLDAGPPIGAADLALVWKRP